MPSEYTLTLEYTLENNIFQAIIKIKGQRKRADSNNIYNEVRKTLDYEIISQE